MRQLDSRHAQVTPFRAPWVACRGTSESIGEKHPRKSSWLFRLMKRFYGLGMTVLSATCACEVEPEVVASRVPTTGGMASGGVAGDWPNREDVPGGSAGATSPSGLLSLSGDLEAHDSTVIEQDGVFYLFSTGEGLPRKTSSDLLHWWETGRVFQVLPDWILEDLPEVTDLWAPEVVEFGGVYHLYYAASTFGSGRSCIGHATKEDLSAEGPWTDLGPVICSDIETEVDWDAIDPTVVEDEGGQFWLAFGSYGSGIKVISLDSRGERDGQELLGLAARPEEIALQASDLFYHGGYYYLVVSFDRCCQGVSSTSNLRVGRAEEVTGPYVDREGRAMLEGGGSLLLEGNDRWRAVGASSALWTQGRSYLVYHAYDANAVGQSTLRISEMSFDTVGWPVAFGP